MTHSQFSSALRVLVMGVSGSGKSTVGSALAKSMGSAFIDGDDLHPAKNIEKMRKGQALTDLDRQPWLAAVATKIAEARQADSALVIVCSALKKDYRTLLRAADPQLVTVFLELDVDSLQKRMKARKHFMPASLLQSQLEALESPLDESKVIKVSNNGSLASVIEEIKTRMAA